jgi:hypothetical protein
MLPVSNKECQPLVTVTSKDQIIFFLHAGGTAAVASSSKGRHISMLPASSKRRKPHGGTNMEEPTFLKVQT